MIDQIVQGGSWIDIEACSALLAVKLAEVERGHLCERRAMTPQQETDKQPTPA